MFAIIAMLTGCEKNGPKAHVEEIRIQGVLSYTEHEGCNQNPLPDVSVHRGFRFSDFCYNIDNQ